MVILGLILLVLGVLAILGAVTTSAGTGDFLGFDDVSTTIVFFVGLAAGVAILWGLGIIRFGTRRSMRHRREQKKLTELSDQLDRAQAGRRHDNDEDQDRPRL